MRVMRPLIAVVALLISAMPGFAQDAGSAAEAAAKPIEQLRLELRPARLAEAEAAAEAWTGFLQETVAAISEARIEAMMLEEQAAKDAALEPVDALTDQRDAIMERLDIVLDAVENRGGDPTEQRAYMESVGGQLTDVTTADPSEIQTMVTDWLTDPDGGIKIGLNIVKFVVVLIIFFIVARILSAAARSALKRSKKTSQLLDLFVVGMIRKTTMLIGLIVAVSMLGVNIGPLVAAVGAAGLVVGLALQGTLSNFASGILILLYRPFDVGEVVEAGGVSGKVEAMTLVSTKISTFDNQVMIVPNNSIWNNVIKNISGRDTRRVDMTFGIGYADDYDRAAAILEEIVKGHEKVMAEPAPTIKMSELADSSVNFIVRPWSKTADYWDVYWDITKEVKRRFDAEGIGIPFPQRDLNFPGELSVVVKNA